MLNINHPFSFDESLYENNSIQNISGQALLDSVKELQQKMEPLIQEHKTLLENKKKLLAEIETQEKIKTLLENPDLFPIEMQKLQFQIDTYSSALNELDQEAVKILDFMQCNTCF